MSLRALGIAALLSTLLAGCCFGGVSGTPASSASSGDLFGFVSQRRGFAAATWTITVDASLATVFCSEGTYFRSCFAVDAAECTERAHRLFAACVEEHVDAIPMQPDAASGRTAGELLGSCAGRAYELELVAEGRTRAAPFCDDPSHWM